MGLDNGARTFFFGRTYLSYGCFGFSYILMVYSEDCPYLFISINCDGIFKPEFKY
jgi:hypothetical protein